MSTPPNATHATHAPDRFEAWLSSALQSDAEPTDATFLARVMDALPPQAAPAKRAKTKAGNHGPWQRHAEGLCMGATAVALALVLEPGTALGALDQTLAGTCLLGLLVWWSLPQLRGGAWR